VLWAAVIASGAEVQRCSTDPVTLNVATQKDAATLIEAAKCIGANITAVWQGSIAIGALIVVGSNTTLIVQAAAQGSATIDGSGTVQLFYVKGGLTLINMNLLNGFAPNSGAAIFAESDSTVTLRSCTISGNRAAINGGGLYANWNSSIAIYDSVFNNNTALSYGGAICTYTSIALSKCTFADNVAVQYNGGGLFGGTDISVTIDQCSFTNNSALVGYGGGVYVGILYFLLYSARCWGHKR
jgi:predicted outer membrane repeat protein